MKIPAWAVGLNIGRVETGLIEFCYESPNLALQRVGARPSTRGDVRQPDIVRVNFECNDKTDLVYIRAHLIVRGEAEERVEAEIRLRGRISLLPEVIADLTRRLMIACGESP